MITKPTNLPRLPGVYLFKNSAGHILYIGKAKSLAARVHSYFTQTTSMQDPQTAQKITALLTSAATIEHIVTHSEQDAILLEEHLIKLHQPPYNVLLKSGDPFLYLHITTDPIPELEITRTKKAQALSDAGDYFGPFTNRRAVRRSYDYLMKVLRLYRCTTKLQHGCLKYHLGICAGTCTGEFDPVAYRVRIELARSLLAGDTHAFQETIRSALQQHHALLQFEQARQLHEYEQSLNELFATIQNAFSLDRYYHALQNLSPQEMQTSDNEHIPLSTDEFHHKISIIEYPEAQKALQQLTGSTTLISTIDCFDISHQQSRHMVGAAVRFTQGIPDPQEFRRFKIRSLTIQNDYAALQEIIKRRYHNPQSLPDLILIDGGKGQLSAAQAVLPHALIISLAKREERIFTSHNSAGVVLDPSSPLGRLLITLRDTAHRTAIRYHTLLAKKEIRSR